MLKAEISIPLILATAAVDIAIFDHHVPGIAETKTIMPGSGADTVISQSARTALVTSAAVAGAISLMARDEMIFVVGSVIALGLYWSNAWARAADPDTGKLPRAFVDDRYMVQAAG